MSTINTALNSSIWGVQSNNQTTAAQTQTQPQVHHHHHKHSSQDSVEISQEGQQAASDKPKSPLDSLVANGTITQDQEDAIRNAFMSARQANKSGTYNSNPTNPISSLVANNTITQAQADSIRAAFTSHVQAGEGRNKTSGIQGHHGSHHHHHNGQQVQEATDPNEALTQTIENNTSVVNGILENAETQDSLTQSQSQSE